MAFIWNNLTKHYSFAEKTNPKDRVEVEVGDALDPSQVHPQVKIKRWDNEVNASIRLIHDSINGSVKVTDDGTKITWSKKAGNEEWKAVFYHRDDLDEGGFEFEIHVPKKPPVNYIQFSVETKSLNWFYQPPLTQAEIDEGAFQPENVIGSYAVYHATKGGMNDSAGMEYKVGKAFHVYRPHVVDSVGNQTWGELSLNGNILTITVPQQFLDTATYPVVIDPTFGYTSVGGNGTNLALETSDTSVAQGQAYTLGVNGTLDSLHVGLRASFGTETADIFAALYREDSAGADSHDLVASVERIDLSVSSAAFFTFTAASESIVADSYIIAAIGDGEDISGVGQRIEILHDTGGSSTRTYSETSTGVGGYATRKSENPWTEVDASLTNIRSLYATYTASGGSSPSASISASPSASPSASISSSPSASISASPSASPSASESASPSASISASPSASESASPSASASNTPSASESASPSASESASPSASPSASESASPSASESASPSASESASPSASESASPSASESASPSASISSSPSPSSSPSASPSASESASPSASISASPSSSPSASISASPSASASSSPSASASAEYHVSTALHVGIPYHIKTG